MSARKQCAVLLRDRGPEARPFHLNNNFMLILAKNYDENARRADRDPHGTLCSPMDAWAPQMPTVSLRAVDHALANIEGGGGSRLAPPRV